MLAAFAQAAAEEACGAFLNQAVLGMIAAGVRGIPIGHTHAQQILAYLHGDIEELTRIAGPPATETAGSGSPITRCYVMNSHDSIRACFAREFAAGEPRLLPPSRAGGGFGVAFHRDHDHDHDHGGGYGGGHTGRFAGPNAADVHGRRRRTGRLGQNGRRRAAVPRFVAANQSRRHHQRHLHARRRRVPLPPQGAPLERIVGVQTGGCPHTAIRDDASANLSAIANFERQFPELEMIVIESGGDNLTACFSRELADVHIFVIDVAEGDKIPRKGGPGISQSDLLIINKIDLAPHVGADLEVMRRDSRKMRGEKPFLMISLRQGDGAEEAFEVGPSAVRITAETFVTPPEFDGLKLARLRRPDRRRAFGAGSPSTATDENGLGRVTSRFLSACCRRFISKMSLPACFICSIRRPA